MIKKAGLFAASLLCTSMAFSESYSNLFVSYFSPQDVATLSRYVDNNSLGGYILWAVNGDTDPLADSSTSLLYQLKSAYDSGKYVNAYWTDWSVYGASAIPYKPYPIPGSASTSSSLPATNQDLEDKLQYVNGLVYSFVEAQTSGDNVGTLYFNDPWSDLTPDDSFCSDAATADICTYQVKSGRTFADSAYMGNFEAFTALKASHPKLSLIMAIGGYAHDDSFEKAFASDQGVNNFVDSTVAIMNHYGIQGVDMDYENPNMTAQQSQDYLKLVTALNAKLSADQFINITLLSSPSYIGGVGSVGFASGVLGGMATLSHVQSFDLMTYDFHGGFDYDPQNGGRTGFLSNVYMPNNAPSGYDAKFSVDTSVKAMTNLGISPEKINVGIPAYGRSIAGIPAGSDGTGLFQVIPGTATIPKGDMDDPSCSTTLPITSSSCSGTFSYGYIVKNLLTNGFVAKDWQDNSEGSYNGATAYASSWAPAVAANYSLEITNNGSSLGITVTVGDFVSDWLSNGGGDKTYGISTSPSTTLIEGEKGLSVSWTTYAGGPAGTCSNMDFTADKHITINASAGFCVVL